jgi:enamine deaminase RidA (YjgF/YER057c/UK114 family)
MSQDKFLKMQQLIDVEKLTSGEREELLALGILSNELTVQPSPRYGTDRPGIAKRAVHAAKVLNEAYDYFPRPSSFSRALAFEIGGHKVVLISGTASVDEEGKTIHLGDFRAQCWRTYRNITNILEAEKMTWRDIVRTTCYLRDIERDYDAFNEVRTTFFKFLNLDPLPASTGIQAILCRSDLLIEIEAIAVCPVVS